MFLCGNVYVFLPQAEIPVDFEEGSFETLYEENFKSTLNKLDNSKENGPENIKIVHAELFVGFWCSSISFSGRK